MDDLPLINKMDLDKFPIDAADWEFALSFLNKSSHCKNKYTNIEDDYCEPDYDTILCWPPTSPGNIAVLSCFGQLNGISYDTSGNATRACLPTGKWAAYSNYSACKELPLYQSHQDDVELTTKIYLGGYVLSLTALFAAVYIFWKYKDLRCLRNSIHMNLMLSYILADLVWTLSFLMQFFPTIDAASCVLLALCLHYFHLSSFFWMFVEGLYLYILVAKTFRGEGIKLPACLMIGWGGPMLVVFVWSIAKGVALYLDNDQATYPLRVCEWASHSLDWIYQFPVIAVLFANVVFLIIIMWVLITKLRSANTVETQQYRKATKALLILIPLLGVTYIFFITGPTEGVTKNIYECIRAALLSTQGFAVALFYCFLNTEVKNTVGHHFKSWSTRRSISSQRNRNSSRDYSRRSRDSLRMYQASRMFKKRESSASVGTTTSFIGGRFNSAKTRTDTAPTHQAKRFSCQQF